MPRPSVKAETVTARPPRTLFSTRGPAPRAVAARRPGDGRSRWPGRRVRDAPRGSRRPRGRRALRRAAATAGRLGRREAGHDGRDRRAASAGSPRDGLRSTRRTTCGQGIRRRGRVRARRRSPPTDGQRRRPGVRAAVAASNDRRVGSPSEPSSAIDQIASVTERSARHEQVDDLARRDVRRPRGSPVSQPARQVAAARARPSRLPRRRRPGRPARGRRSTGRRSPSTGRP